MSLPTAVPKPSTAPREPRPRFKRRVRGVNPALRRQVFDRDARTCQWCREPGGHLDPHHRLPRSRGGRDTLECLVSVHRRCHRALHENPLEAKRRGFTVSDEADLGRGWT